MRLDLDIKRDVEDELRWDPDIDATDIAVSVKNGVVTLAGFVRSYSQKYEAEQAAKRVAGVVGVANDIEVRLPIFNQRPDPEIARDAVRRFRVSCRTRPTTSASSSRTAGSRSRARPSGIISASGPKRRVRRVRGVKGVSNLIRLESRVPPSEDQEKDRGGLSPQRRARRFARHGRVRRGRSDPPGVPCAHGRNARRPSEPPGRRPA